MGGKQIFFLGSVRCRAERSNLEEHTPDGVMPKGLTFQDHLRATEAGSDVICHPALVFTSV